MEGRGGEGGRGGGAGGGSEAGAFTLQPLLPPHPLRTSEGEADAEAVGGVEEFVADVGVVEPHPHRPDGRPQTGADGPVALGVVHAVAPAERAEVAARVLEADVEPLAALVRVAGLDGGDETVRA